jgi:hypothetical protein
MDALVAEKMALLLQDAVWSRSHSASKYLAITFVTRILAIDSVQKQVWQVPR